MPIPCLQQLDAITQLGTAAEKLKAHLCCFPPVSSVAEHKALTVVSRHPHLCLSPLLGFSPPLGFCPKLHQNFRREVANRRSLPFVNNHRHERRHHCRLAILWIAASRIIMRLHWKRECLRKIESSWDLLALPVTNRFDRGLLKVAISSEPPSEARCPRPKTLSWIEPSCNDYGPSRRHRGCLVVVAVRLRLDSLSDLLLPLASYFDHQRGIELRSLNSWRMHCQSRCHLHPRTRLNGLGAATMEFHTKGTVWF